MVLQQAGVMAGKLLMVSLQLLLLIGTAAGVECPGGWFRIGMHCYWLGQQPMSFEDGQGVCASWEASLVSLSTPAELGRIQAGLHTSPSVRQVWTGALYDLHLQSWIWLDGAPYTASSVPWWGGLEPKLLGVVSERCAVLTVASGRMNQTACTARATPFCRRSAYKRELCKEDDGWHAIGQSCYKLFNDKQTWIDADKVCRDQTATLLPLPFSDTVRSVIQETVVCDTSDNDLWISSVDVSSPLSTQCNWVSVMYNQILVQGSCLKERKFICQKPQGSCAEGWLSHEGRCYRSPSASLPWFSASQSCQNLGAALLVISDLGEENFIKTKMIYGSFAKQIWLGLSDKKQDGRFEWSDGTAVSNVSSHWAPGFPRDSPGEQCGSMQLVRTDAFWYDGYCYKSLPFVCEMSLSDDVRNITQSDSCEVGWKLAGGQCYYAGGNKDYSDAATFCASFNKGTLASVHTPLDMSYLAVVVAGMTEAWIGLQRPDNSKHFVWADDGTVVTTSNWLPGEPKNGTAGGGAAMSCVQILGASSTNSLPGAWRTQDCGQPSAFICQLPARKSTVVSPQPGTQVTQPWSWRCGEGWALSPTLSSCFLMVTQVTVPWASARAQCQRQGADLVSISSYREQTLVQALVRSAGLAAGGGAWSGLWIGATDNSREGGWQWADSSPFRFLQWSAGQPDNRGWGGEEQDCAVAMPAVSMLWDDRDCDELHNYICEKPAAPESTTPPVSGITQQPSGRCEGWAMMSGLYSVADSMILASSSSDADHGPAKSRLLPANTGSWISSPKDTAPWVGVLFETLVTVRGVQTAGSGGGGGGWVSHYKLQYRYDSTSPPYWYSDPPGTPAKVFRANNDSQTPVTSQLAFPFAARQVFLFPTNWTGSAPALRWEILGCPEEDCGGEYAVSGPLLVPDTGLTASSSSDASHTAPRVRMTPLNPGGTLSCWRPIPTDQGSSQWIQVDFERVQVLRGVSTRGNPAAAEWVRTFVLLYHPDGLPPTDQSWKPYEEPYGTAKVFTGNVDSNTTVTTYLKSYIPTRRVRLQPQTWQNHVALQLDLLVCQTGCQEQPLLAAVSDEQLTATSSLGQHGPEASRLSGGKRAGGTGHPSTGGWQARFSRPDQYIQVSLNVPQEVRAVATQGSRRSNSWVKDYYLAWSLDAKNWTNYTDNGHVQTFSGNSNPETVRRHELTPFMAQYVRLHPTHWSTSIALSWELYGCPGKNAFQSIGCYADHSSDRDLAYEPYTDRLDGMDPILCSRHCFGKGYSYAGLQARDKCFCGNSYGRYGMSPDCNIQCFPQKQFNCGGMTANFVYSTGLTAGFSVCPTGWRRLRGQCYQHFSTLSSWASARAACGSYSAHLASVPDHSVNLLLYSLMGTATVKNLAWIGLNDIREERYFEWSNEEEVVYTEWDLRQPAPSVTGESRHCVAVNNQTGGWRTEDCSRRLPYLCMTNPHPSAQQPNITATPAGCPQGTVAYLSFCYVVVEENRTWSAAGDVCTAFGAERLVINTRFEQAFVTSLLSGRSGLYWTDVSDVHDPGVFTYSGGQYDIMYTNWDSGMPDSHRYGHCVALGSGSRAGLWRNVACGQPAKAICRLLRDNYPQPAIPVIRHHSNCSLNWVATNSSLCYQINKVTSNLQRSWAEARADCGEQQGDLASFINTPLMDDFWRHKLLGSSNHFWIGLHTLASGVLAWSDGSPVTLDGPWSAGQPDTKNGTQGCVELHAPSGTLALQDCRMPRNWLCAIRSGVTPFPRLSERLVPTAGPAGSCLPLDDTWKRYGDFCYRVVSQQPATWRQARQACQQDNADLASVTDVKENAFVLALAQKTPQQKVWLGLNELMSPRGYYGWSDGSRVSFVNWDGDGPDDADGQESCAEMLVRTGKWNDNHCALPQAYVCKRNMSPFPPTTPTTRLPSSGGCGGAGWVLFGSRCYLLQGQQRGKTWQEAFQDCRSKTTPYARVTLASARGPRENAFLTTQLYKAGMLAWVGLRRVNMTFLWVDEDDVTYTNWDTGEPNGGKQAGCVYLYPQGANAGRWNDEDCSRRLGWICESTRFPYWNLPATPPSHCPSGFHRLGTSCYLYSNASHLSWQGAQTSCHARGAHLASVLSQVEQDFVYLAVTGGEPVYFQPSQAKVVYPPAWIGLIGSLVNKATLWQWSDGWPVAFTNWGPGGYLNVTTTNHCVAMDSNGTWFNQDCSVPRPFVCKINSETPPYTRDPSSGECVGHQWSAFGSHCYMFNATDRVTFAHAAFTCSQLGASLVSIHSESTNQFLQNKVKAMSALPVWIGFRRPDKGTYAWRDQSRVDFTNWDTGFPKGSNGDGTSLSCAQLTPWSGRWIDVDCNALYGYVCVKNKEYETSTTTTTPKGQGRAGSVPMSERLRMRHRPRASSTATATPDHVRSPTPVATHPPTAAMPGKFPGVGAGGRAGGRASQWPPSVRSGVGDSVPAASGMSAKSSTAMETEAHHDSSQNNRDSQNIVIPAAVAGVVVVVLVVVVVVVVVVIRRRRRLSSVRDFIRHLYQSSD